MSKYEDPKEKKKGTYLITGWRARIFFMWGKRKKKEGQQLVLFYYFYLKCKCLWVFINYRNFLTSIISSNNCHLLNSIN